MICLNCHQRFNPLNDFRNDSPSVILKSSANSNNKLINEIIIPPPPPPRRYLRCLSTGK